MEPVESQKLSSFLDVEREESICMHSCKLDLNS